MTDLIEAILMLFWGGYMLLHVYLLRAPVNEKIDESDSLQGEPLCTTPATK
ncbi:MAG: hypothetical protein RL369_1853 [Pseudomonadota bacterium]|jgi:hypothetical protein